MRRGRVAGAVRLAGSRVVHGRARGEGVRRPRRAARRRAPGRARRRGGVGRRCPRERSPADPGTGRTSARTVEPCTIRGRRTPARSRGPQSISTTCRLSCLGAGSVDQQPLGAPWPARGARLRRRRRAACLEHEAIAPRPRLRAVTPVLAGHLCRIAWWSQHHRSPLLCDRENDVAGLLPGFRRTSDASITSSSG